LGAIGFKLILLVRKASVLSDRTLIAFKRLQQVDHGSIRTLRINIYEGGEQRIYLKMLVLSKTKGCIIE